MQVIKYRGENMNFKELNQMVVNSYEFNTPDMTHMREEID
jgi:hypothetical protein